MNGKTLIIYEETHRRLKMEAAAHGFKIKTVASVAVNEWLDQFGRNKKRAKRGRAAIA